MVAVKTGRENLFAGRVWQQVAGQLPRHELVKGHVSVEGFNRAAFLHLVLKETDYYSFPRSQYRVELDRWFDWADIVNFHWVADFLDFSSFFGQLGQNNTIDVSTITI